MLDSGPYPAEPWAEADAASVTMTSADDPHTGLRLHRWFTLYTDRAAYRLEITALNCSARPVRWAIWNVTQFPAADLAGGVRLGSGPEVLALVSGTGVPSYRFDDARQVVHVPHQDVVGKLGFPAATGWLTHTGSGAALTQRFAVIDGAPYPDGGSRVEVWLEHPVARPLAELGGLDPPARIMECEVLGPLVDLAPGESTSLILDCEVHPAAAP